MARKYFATRDEYAKVNGYTNDHARIELEYLFGVTFPEDSPPKGPKVRLREYHGDTRWFMSITDYDKEALARLVQGSEMAVTEAST